MYGPRLAFVHGRCFVGKKTVEKKRGARPSGPSSWFSQTVLVLGSRRRNARFGRWRSALLPAPPPAHVATSPPFHRFPLPSFTPPHHPSLCLPAGWGFYPLVSSSPNVGEKAPIRSPAQRAYAKATERGGDAVPRARGWRTKALVHALLPEMGLIILHEWS